MASIFGTSSQFTFILTLLFHLNRFLHNRLIGFNAFYTDVGLHIHVSFHKGAADSPPPLYLPCLNPAAS